MGMVELWSGDLPVQGDGDEVEYGGRAAEDVRGRPHVAELGTEGPPLADLVDGGEGHHEAGDEEVGYRQREDQVVGHVLQVALQQDGCDHEDVT